MTLETNYQNFKELLDEQYQWPTTYLFKFVSPLDKIEKLEEIFEGQDIAKRPSRTGKFISLTISSAMNSSDEVVSVYKEVNSIQGVIPL